MTYYLNKRSNEGKDKSNKTSETKSKMKTKTNSQQISCVKFVKQEKTSFFVYKWNQYGQGLIDLLRKTLRVSEKN